MAHDVIQLQRLLQGSIHSRMCNSHILSETLKTTDAMLDKMKTAIICARADNTLTMPYCVYVMERLEMGSICAIPSGPFDSHMSDLSLESIDKIIKANADVATSVIGGLNKDVIDYIHGKTLYVGVLGTGFNGSLTKHTIVRPDVCVKCDQNVIDGPMEDHVRGLQCLEQVRENMIAEKKLIQVNSDVEIELIRAGVIPFQYHPIGFGMYIEPWVDQAIRVYDTQKSRGAFAEMPLSEYLKHMI